MDKVFLKYLKPKTYQRILKRLREKRIFKKTVPLLLVVQIIYQKFQDTDEHQQASSIAFSFTLSLFPAILFLFSLVPYIAYYSHIPNLSNQILGLLQEAIPSGIYEFVAPTIQDIIENPRGGVLSFGFFFALYAATSAVVEMMNTFNTNYKFSEKRTYLKKRLIAVWLAFVFAFLMVFAVTITIVGEVLLNYVSEHLKTVNIYYLVVSLRYLVSFLVFYIAISYIYYIAPAVSKNWRFFSLGSTFAALLIIISTKLFSFYLSNFATYNKLYGSIGMIIAIMVWFYVLAWILLVCFTLDASLKEAKIFHQTDMETRYALLEDIGIENEPKKSAELSPKK
jgi:membrane protein